MKYILLAIVLIAFCGVLIERSRSISYRRFRQRAERLAMVQIVDGTRLVAAPESPNQDNIVFTNVTMSYAPLPVLTVTEWSEGGMVGSGKTPSGMQWSCPPGYKLKFDGTIPYCE